MRPIKALDFLNPWKQKYCEVSKENGAEWKKLWLAKFSVEFLLLNKKFRLPLSLAGNKRETLKIV